MICHPARIVVIKLTDFKIHEILSVMSRDSSLGSLPPVNQTTSQNIRLRPVCETGLVQQGAECPLIGYF